MRMGNHNGGATAARGTDGAEEMGEAEAEIALGLEPLALSAPQPGQRALLADPHLVLEPKFDRCHFGVDRRDFGDHPRQYF